MKPIKELACPHCYWLRRDFSTHGNLLAWVHARACDENSVQPDMTEVTVFCLRGKHAVAGATPDRVENMIGVAWSFERDKSWFGSFLTGPIEKITRAINGGTP